MTNYAEHAHLLFCQKLAPRLTPAESAEHKYTINRILDIQAGTQHLFNLATQYGVCRKHLPKFL
jgi:hypothetical protein